MREDLWLFLRKSSLLRKLYAHRSFAGPMRMASHLLVPSSGQRRMQVRAGPAKGLLLDVDPRWEHTAWDGTYELPALELFNQLLRPGMIVFDVGAGVGLYALLAARARAYVIAFEPDPENAKGFAEHLDSNRVAERVRIVRKAVFSHSGCLTLEVSKGAQAHRNTKVQTTNSDVTEASLEVSCTTLDDFIENNPTPSLVKVDVEGAESNVLKGADRLFRIGRPRLLCEVHDDANTAFVRDWLQEREYICDWIENKNSFPRHLSASPREK